MSEPDTSVTRIPALSMPPPNNRLSIADLFVITLGAAIAIWFLQEPATFSDNRAVIVVNVVMSPLYGSAVAGLILATYRLLNALPPFATQPGHWLLLIEGTMFSGIGLLTNAVPAVVVSENQETWGLLLAVPPVFGGWLLAWSLVLIYRCARDSSDGQPPHWQVVFPWIVVTLITSFFGACLLPAGSILILLPMLIIFVPPIVLYGAVLRAIVIDMRNKEYRDHWHWLGVAAFLGLPAHVALLILAVYLQSTNH